MAILLFVVTIWVLDVSVIASTVDDDTRLVTTPPITYTPTIEEDDFAEDEEYRIAKSNSDTTMASCIERLPVATIPLFDSLDERMYNYTDNLMDRFPNLDYTDEFDGENLRNITTTIQDLVAIGDATGSSGVITRVIRRTAWMRKWVWTMVSMMEYMVRRPNLTIAESARILISMAPSMHAFLYSLFMLKLDFPDLFFGFQNIVHTVVKYNPLYMGGDPVWYLRLVPELSGPHGNPSVSLISLPLDIPDVDLLDTRWGGFLEQIRSRPDRLVRRIHELIGSPMFATSAARPAFTHASPIIGSLGLAMYTVRYFREFEPSIFSQLVAAGLLDLKPSGFEARLSNMITTLTRFRHLMTVRSIWELFGQSITNPRILLKHIIPIDHASHKYMSTSSDDFVETVSVVLEDSIMETLISISRLSKFALAGRLLLNGDDFETLIEYFYADVFDPRNKVFKQVATGVYRPSEIASEQPEILIGVGRILGITFKIGNPEDVIGRYLGRPSRTSLNNGTTLNPLFFESTHIRKGFYDVILENTIESMFPLPGVGIISALDILSRQTFVL